MPKKRKYTILFGTSKSTPISNFIAKSNYDPQKMLYSIKTSFSIVAIYKITKFSEYAVC